MQYLLFIWFLSQLFAVILLWLFKILQGNASAFSHRLEKNAKLILKGLQILILFPVIIIILILFCLLYSLSYSFISFCGYFIYCRERQAAQNPETEPEQLRKLAEVRDPGTQRRVANNPNTPPDLLLKLGKQYPRELLANPVFSLLLLEDTNLFATMPKETLKSLMTVKDIPVGFLERTAAIPNLEVEIAQVIARHPQATDYVFTQLARYSGDAAIFKSLLKRSSLSTEILEKLAANGVVGIKQYLSYHSSLPGEALEKIIRYAVETPPAQQTHHFDAFLRALAEYGKPQLQAQLIQQPQLPDALLEALAEHGTEQVQLQLLQRFHLPSKALETLLKRGHLKVQVRLAQHPALHTYLLKRLYYDRRSIIRKQIVQHPHTSVELLRNLARDNNAQVRRAALQRLAQQDFHQ